MIRIDKWAGLVTNASQYALPAGATVEQVNVQCVSPGKLTVRQGLAAVQMPVPGGSAAIVKVFRYQHGPSEHLVYQDAVGDIYSSAVVASAIDNRVTPSEPVISTVLSGNKSLTVTLEPPAVSGSSPVIGYTLQVSSNGGSSWVPSGSTADSSYVIPDLTNDTPYLVRALASNAFGPGPFCAPFGPVAPTGPILTAPGKPVSVSATPGAARAVVRWEAPAFDGNSAITAYKVQFSSDRGATWTLFGTSTATTIEVTGLLNRTDYVFRVLATNALGDSDYSDASASITINYSISLPGAPRSVTVNPGTNSAIVSWLAPLDDGGAAIVRYRLVWRRGSTIVSTATTTTTSYTIPSLTVATSYSVSVDATNDTANYGLAATASFTTLQFATPPAAVTATSTAISGGVKFAWTPPSTTGGSAITGYRIGWLAPTAAFQTWPYPNVTLVDAATVEKSVDGYAAGQSIRFGVSAVNASGEGAATLLTRVAGGVPAAPTVSVTVPAQAGAITLSIVPGNTYGLSVLSNEITLVNPQPGDSVEPLVLVGSNSYTFTGLTIGRSYQWSVRTRTAIGLGGAFVTPATAPRSAVVAPAAPVVAWAAANTYGAAWQFTGTAIPAAGNTAVINGWQFAISVDGGATFAYRLGVVSGSTYVPGGVSRINGSTWAGGGYFVQDHAYASTAGVSVVFQARAVGEFDGNAFVYSPWVTSSPKAHSPAAPAASTGAWVSKTTYPYEVDLFVPKNGGRPITGYLFKVGTQSPTSLPATLPLKITDGPSSYSAQWSVAAVNDVGVGPYVIVGGK